MTYDPNLMQYAMIWVLLSILLAGLGALIIIVKLAVQLAVTTCQGLPPIFSYLIAVIGVIVLLQLLIGVSGYAVAVSIRLLSM